MRRAWLFAIFAGMLLLAPIRATAGPGELQTAAQAGDVSKIQQILSQTPELLNAVDEKGETALFAAVRAGRASAVELLLANGSDAQLKNKRGATVLHLAAAEGNRDADARKVRKDIGAMLLKSGAAVNATDAEGMTALHVALARQREELVELLLTNGADLKLKDTRGRTPLHYAAQGNMADVIDRLAEKEADVNTADNAGNTALHLASLRMRSEAVEHLIKLGANLNAVNKQGETPLHTLAGAPTRGSEAEPKLIEVADLLIAAGADVNVRAANGMTPLGRAEAKEHLDLARFLEGKGGVR